MNEEFHSNEIVSEGVLDQVVALSGRVEYLSVPKQKENIINSIKRTKNHTCDVRIATMFLCCTIDL